MVSANTIHDHIVVSFAYTYTAHRPVSSTCPSKLCQCIIVLFATSTTVSLGFTLLYDQSHQQQPFTRDVNIQKTHMWTGPLVVSRHPRSVHCHG